MGNEVIAKGTKLQSGNTTDYATATTWTTVAEVVSVKPPKRSAPKIDVTDLESEAKESLPGLPEVGDAEATIKYTEAGATTLDGLFNVPKAWRVLYPDGSGRMWNGWIMEDGEEEVQNGEIITAGIKIAATGNYEPFASE